LVEGACLFVWRAVQGEVVRSGPGAVWAVLDVIGKPIARWGADCRS